MAEPTLYMNIEGGMYVCDNEMLYSITREGILMYYSKFVRGLYLDITDKTYLENANLF